MPGDAATARANLGITPDNIGAAPSGYGYGDKPEYLWFSDYTNEATLNDKLQEVFASMRDQSTKQIQSTYKDGGTVLGTLYRYNTDWGFYHAAGYNGRVLHKIKSNGLWHSYVECTPSAYGLGGNAAEVKIAAIAELDSCKKNGWYAIWPTAGTLYVGSIPFNTLLLEVSFLNDYYGWQIVRTLDNYTLKRKYHEGHWGEWEYENPPMKLGVEYRTTERYMGNPVYCKLVDCGKGTTTGAMNLYPQVGTNIMYLDFNCRARSESGWGCLLDHLLVFAGYGANDGTISLKASQDLTAYNIYLEVKYYKV